MRQNHPALMPEILIPFIMIPDGTVADIGAYYLYQFQVTQEITLTQGYSFMSSRIIPSNPDMLIVMDSVLNENLDYVKKFTRTDIA